MIETELPIKFQKNFKNTTKPHRKAPSNFYLYFQFTKKKKYSKRLNKNATHSHSIASIPAIRNEARESSNKKKRGAFHHSEVLSTAQLNEQQ